MDEWIKKNVVYILTDYYTAIKKNEMLPFMTTWLGLEGVKLNESVSER